MAERYFEKFQIIPYANTAVVNITQRAAVLSSVYANPNLYYLYEIKPYERPDVIADEYYQDQYMSWIMYLTNKIIDPYYDWSIDTDSFNAFILKKYGTLERATTRIKYYRNNWYDNQEQISTSAFNSLIPELKEYYEPVYYDDVRNTTTSGYIRKRIDWKHNTNSIVRYEVSNGSSFISDEVVKISFDASTIGRGQITYANTTHVLLQHMSGVVATGTITANSYLYGVDSKTNTVFTSATFVSNNIPSVESNYWSPVTYYDYENEINTKNKTIQVLNKQYSTQISKELNRLLK